MVRSRFCTLRIAVRHAQPALFPFRIPAWIARFVAGKELVALAQTSRAASNAKAKAELGWTPSIPSWRQGFSREGL